MVIFATIHAAWSVIIHQSESCLLLFAMSILRSSVNRHRYATQHELRLEEIHDVPKDIGPTHTARNMSSEADWDEVQSSANGSL
jgi:hypothetical protein